MRIPVIILLVFVFMVCNTSAAVYYPVCNSGGGSANCSMNYTCQQGPEGPEGSPGQAATINVNWTFTGAGGTAALVTNVGSTSAALFDFTIPQGEKGDKGDKGDIGLPNMTSGTPGTPASIDVNYTFTGAPGTNAVITNIGTTQDALLDVTIPSGADGSPGTPGADATVTVNATFTAPNGTPASVVNIGTPGAALLDITIPEGIWGAVGDPGTPGTPATVAINATFQVSNTTPASVVNIGTPSDVLLDVSIPEGITGAAGSDASVPDQTHFPFLNGSRILTGKWNFGGYNISNVGNPIVGTDAATWNWVLSQIASALTPYDTIANQSAANTSMKNYVDTRPAIADETAYYWVNATRPLTGTQIFRNVNNSFLYLNGGSGSGTGGLLPGSGALIALYGNTAAGGAAGYTRFYAPDAAGTAWNIVMFIPGVTDTPYLSLNTHKIGNVSDPTIAQDAATMHYVEYPTVTASAQANALCYNTTTKRVTYNSGLTTCLASAEIMKTNITYIQGNYTSQLMQLKPVYYTSKIDGLNHYGLLAEDVVKVVPELAAYNEQGGLSGVRYEEFTALLLKGFQEQLGNNTGASPDMSWNTTYPLLSGVRTLTGKWNFGGFNASNIGIPIASSDAATRDWTLSQINSSPVSGSADNLTYALLSGLRQYTGKMDLGKNNVSNTTSVTGGDAINLTLATAFNNSMRDNVSANFPTTSTLIAVNNTQNARKTLPRLDSSATTTSLAGENITGLKWIQPASTTVQFSCLINDGSSVATGIKVGMYTPASSTLMAMCDGDVKVTTGSTIWNKTKVSANGTMSTELFHMVADQTGLIRCDGTLKTGASAGEPQILLASFAAGTVTANAGSYCKVERMGTTTSW